MTVSRSGYSQPKTISEYPLDGELNLAKDQFSDGLRLQIAAQINHCAYDHVVEHISQTTGGKIAKRQCMSLVKDMAQDFDAYYLKDRYNTPEQTKDLLVLTIRAPARNKRVWASVEQEAKQVILDDFKEALQRDPMQNASE
mgnify:FL=1